MSDDHSRGQRDSRPHRFGSLGRDRVETCAGAEAAGTGRADVRVLRRASDEVLPDRAPGPRAYGVEAQILDPVDPIICRTFREGLDPTRTPREMAIAWAQAER